MQLHCGDVKVFLIAVNCDEHKWPVTATSVNMLQLYTVVTVIAK